MGGCASKESNPFEEFKVTNINDQHRLVHSGIMYVTDTELIYIDKKSHDKWEWPLKYLRRYGCEGFVFSFEAGRKCPSGEGLYAFNCKKANGLFNRVARNISQGNLEPTEPELPERNVTEVPFPPKVQQLPTVPNGTARNSSSAILPITLPDLPPPLPPTPPPPSNQNGQSNVNYTHLQFEKGSEALPPPLQGDQVNYTKIDMPKTIEVSRLRQKVEFHGNGGLPARRQTTGPIPNKKRPKPGSRSSSCSSSSSLNTEIKVRSLDDGNLRRGSVPDVRSLGQQRTSPPLLPPTLTEAPVEGDTDLQTSTATTEANYLNINIAGPENQRIGPENQRVGPENQHVYTNMNIVVSEMEQNYANITPVDEHNYTNIPIGGGSGGGEVVVDVIHSRPSVSALDSEHNYSNINLPAGADMEHNYTNISIGASSVEDPSILQQSNYQNLIPGQGLVSSTPVAMPTQNSLPSLSTDPGSPGFGHPRSNTFNHPQTKSSVTPNSTSTLPLIKGTGGDTMQTYIELDINPKESTAMGSYAELEISAQQHTSSGLTPVIEDTERLRSHSAIVSTSNTASPDTPDTLYKELNFKEMDALHAMAQERKHLKEVGDTPPHMESDKEHKKQKSKK